MVIFLFHKLLLSIMYIRAVQKSVQTGNPDQTRPNHTVWFGSIKNWFGFGLRNMRTVKTVRLMDFMKKPRFEPNRTEF